MAFWKFTGASAEAFPELDVTAQPGYVYDLGSSTPPVEELPKEGQAYPLISSNWASDPGPATDGLVKQRTDFDKPPNRTGTATLVAGTVTVADTNIKVNSRIRTDSLTIRGGAGLIFITAKTANTSFVITSSNAGETSDVRYEVWY
jgi:hypothetical protein